LDWLARATNWAKMTATASLGVIHRGHEHDALALMQSYLPREAGPTSGYSEGGGLYALGLIHANHGAAITDYLLQQLSDAQNEVIYKNYLPWRSRTLHSLPRVEKRNKMRPAALFSRGH